MKPIKCSDLDIAFPASVAAIMPAYDTIPKAFRPGGANPWLKLAEAWFYRGIDGEFVTKEGIDIKDALRHLKRILGSYEPKQEHKMAAVAFLMSEWFIEFRAVPEKTKVKR